MIVDIAASSRMSAMPAKSVDPIGLLASISTIRCRPLLRKRTLVGAAPSPPNPTNCVASERPAPSTKSTPSFTLSVFTAAQLAPVKGTDWSKSARPQAITRAPRATSYPPDTGKSPKASVPYSASYKDPQRAFAAFNAKRALVTGTTSCAPDIVAISGSTFEVSTSKSAPSGIR